jgi:hypothetical protein
MLIKASRGFIEVLVLSRREELLYKKGAAAAGKLLLFIMYF